MLKTNSHTLSNAIFRIAQIPIEDQVKKLMDSCEYEATASNDKVDDEDTIPDRSDLAKSVKL